MLHEIVLQELSAAGQADVLTYAAAADTPASDAAWFIGTLAATIITFDGKTLPGTFVERAAMIRDWPHGLVASLGMAYVEHLAQRWTPDSVNGQPVH